MSPCSKAMAPVSGLTELSSETVCRGPLHDRHEVSAAHPAACAPPDIIVAQPPWLSPAKGSLGLSQPGSSAWVTGPPTGGVALRIIEARAGADREAPGPDRP